MQSHKTACKILVAALALLITACSPAATAQTPTAAPTNTVAPTVVADAPPAGSPTPIVTVGSTAPTTATVATVATVANTPTVATTATTVATTPVAAQVAAASPQGAAYDNRTSPVDLLAAYYDAINRQEYQRAYGYWQTAPLDYNAFAAGYADTTSVQLIVQPPTAIEGAAGSLYAAIPTFLIAQHTNGSTHSFAGCIITRKSNVEPFETPDGNLWHLYQARLGEVANNANIPTQLASACAS